MSNTAKGDGREIRNLAVSELRAGSGDLPTLEGYAAVFDEASEPIGGMFREYVTPEAFTRTLRDGADVRALVDHDPSKILGRTTAGTLRLREDHRGLLATISPPDTTAGRDITESVRRGDVSQMSFAFSVREQRWDDNAGGDMPARHLVDVDLHDVSVVTYPAYKGTEISARTIEVFEDRQRHAAAMEMLKNQETILMRKTS